MSDPHSPSGISVTIKADEPGGKYNDAKVPGSWIVFHGTPASVREQICEVFGLEEGPYKAPLFELVNEATALFKAAAGVKQILGGTVLSTGSQAQAGGDVWAQAAAARDQAAASKQEEENPLLSQVENSPNVIELQQVWAENQEAFNTDAALMAAYKAKGKSLTAAA